MAVVFEGFSIREYASNMRSIDVVKCWPFSGAPSSSDDDDDNNGNNSKNIPTKQSIESLLPPITVTKFRWWSQELDLLKNKHHQPSCSQTDFLQLNNLHVERPSDMLECLDCGNAHHVHSCLTQPSTQQMRMLIKTTKSRTPKKRSITDIFATAPQIHGNERPKKKKKKKKKKVATVKKLMNKRSKLKKNNKQDAGQIANKENGSRLKLQTPVNFNRKPNNTLRNRGSNAISILGVKPSLKCMFAKKKSKPFQEAKLIVEGEKPCFPVRGILKNPGISGKNAAMCNLRDTTQASTCGVQRSVKHVSLSGKDDILGSHKEFVDSFEETTPHVDLDSFEETTPHVDLDSFEETNPHVDLDSFEETTTHADLDSFEETTPHVDLDSFEETTPHVDLDSFELSGKGHQSDGAREINTSDDEDVSFSTENGIAVQAVKEKQLLPAIHYNVDIPKFLGPRILAQEKVNHFSDRSLSPVQVVLDSGNLNCSKANPGASLHPSSAGFSSSKSANETAPFTLQFAPGNVPGHALSHQKIYHPTPNVLMGRLYPFLDCKQKQVSSREKCWDAEFFGLPLNSLGELVHTNSNGKGGFNQLRKPSQLSLFPDENHMKENATVHSPARLGATELQGRRKDGYCIHSDWRCNHSDCLMNTSSSGCGPYDQFWNRKEKVISHVTENSEKMFLNSPTPTMRLMGKDVTICRSSNEKQGFADAPKSSALQNTCVDKHFQQELLLNQASGKCKERPVRRFEIASNHAFPSNVIMRPLESNFLQPGLNSQANPEFQISSSSTTIAPDHNPRSHYFAHPHTSHATFDSGDDCQEPFTSRNETARASSRLPSVSASHRNYQNIKGNSVELQNNQNLPNARKLSFNFPFLLPDNVETSWCRESSKSLVPWLLQATQQVQAASTPSQPFPEVDGRCHSHTAQTTFNRLVPRFPIASYDNNLMISYSHMGSSVGQPSLAHSPLITSIPVIKPRKEIMFKDRMKSKFVSTQDPDIRQNARKRPAVKLDYLMKPIKVPNLGIQDESRNNFINDIQCNMGSLEIEPKRNEANIGGRTQNKSRCNGLGLSTGIDSSTVDANSVTRMGSIKLSPGVKHILKPHQNVDQDNSRLIHSTIPYASLTECGNILETREKSTTKIYRF